MSTDSIVKASNWRLVEVGRVVLIKKGQSAGKLAAIVEIIDQKKVLIDGPKAGVPRQAINLGQVVLTPLTFALPRGARTATVSKKWAAAGVCEKWAASSWAKKIAQRERRAALTDFERFQVMVLRKQKRYTVKKALAKA
ncbi:AQG_2a_G0033770.mRNA.1.CDS.1 [Saccharomyces cerevisiae]|uniref:Large ribosomal subunit protein eL14B n=7 Tax=Saccharomyces TaxID=4930 RepID=RL14B_YEAST|nr:ribosomal 60S subunit protein L14B [Saccharomyces cerevisiae S288C]P38754.1 RecName: Full=Large ribosomal subunit protein eL14B; AltName: Full=60S ribosomal protein L14-B [Saccharomyces cerevisiae S288C]AAB68426.1 Rpl14bp: Probable 60S ribosomal protein L14EB [Saccharomyces cerevisiae]AHY76238.1 Rpl14ap [Saccharomyces cerevisiae YJM993]AJP39095.1 Rpl14bp [Saccharomyces cerevisiae YJM1078]AJS30230.1 Rpl14ap [Saccharomyces cerevisiae YJM189]AJS30531.1 Rpl14ap [Saccharomyces cerevisiae YJM193|eukprot:NP_011862.1 ribosomal 60S subunit protein L14B [Saccharomyces cerevisiae S288C]